MPVIKRSYSHKDESCRSPYCSSLPHCHDHRLHQYPMTCLVVVASKTLNHIGLILRPNGAEAPGDEEPKNEIKQEGPHQKAKRRAAQGKQLLKEEMPKAQIADRRDVPSSTMQEFLASLQKNGMRKNEVECCIMMVGYIQLIMHSTKLYFQFCRIQSGLQTSLNRCRNSPEWLALQSTGGAWMAPDTWQVMETKTHQRQGQRQQQ